MKEHDVQFSPLKILGQLERIRTLKHGGNIAPVTVEFHLTNGCNHDCWFCSDAVRRDTGKGAKLPWEIIERTLNDFADMGVKSIVFEGGGEPTAHKHFQQAFSLARDLGLECGLTTHGGLLKRDGIRATVADAAHWIRMSIDSASPEAHMKMHRYREGEFDQVMENARAIRDLNHTLVLGWSFIISDENWTDIEKAAHLAEEIGFSYIDFKPLLVDRRRYYLPDGQEDLLKNVIDKLDGKKSTRRSHPFRVYAARIDGSEPRKPDFSVCQSHRFIGNVAATGDVFVCCAHAMLEGDARPIERDTVVLGSLYEQSFKEIWESEHRQDVVEAFMQPAIVSKCPSCRFGHHNEVLEAAVCTKFSPFV